MLRLKLLKIKATIYLQHWLARLSASLWRVKAREALEQRKRANRPWCGAVGAAPPSRWRRPPDRAMRR